MVSDQVVKLGIEIKLVLYTNCASPVISVVSPAVIGVGRSTTSPLELAIMIPPSMVNTSVSAAGII